jgi:hypothetical protein
MFFSFFPRLIVADGESDVEQTLVQSGLTTFSKNVTL